MFPFTLVKNTGQDGDSDEEADSPAPHGGARCCIGSVHGAAPCAIQSIGVARVILDAFTLPRIRGGAS